MSWCLVTQTAVLVGNVVCAVLAQTKGHQNAFRRVGLPVLWAGQGGYRQLWDEPA